MAFIRKRDNSPFWRLKYRDLDTGMWREESTGLRTDLEDDTRKAQRMADEKSLKEKRIGTPGAASLFSNWVPDWIDRHYVNKPSTRRRVLITWAMLRKFLAEREAFHPRRVKYAHAQDYMAWRRVQKVRGRMAKHNTALLELKFLSQIMNEAVRREHCEANPLARTGITKAAQKEKPELTDAQIATIRKEAKTKPRWFGDVVEISLYSGCRFSECEIPMTRVDFDGDTITMRDAKRNENDPRKLFEIPIHPSLRPTLERLRDEGATITCELNREKNNRFNAWLREIGIHTTHHSFRVTFVTRCHRGGVSETQAMALVNHSSRIVHQIYSRLNQKDKRTAQAKIPLPA